jgi:phage tail sheath protein FI
MPFQLSPGVAVVEKDFTSIVPAVSSSIGAFAGTFPWGPTLEPITVSSENDLVRRFGKPNDSNFQSFFTAANFLSYTNNLLLVRADAGSLNAVAVKTAGISSFTVGTAGSGYVSTATPPVVTIGAPNDPDGIQAAGTAVLSGGAITAVAVSSGGTGYTTAPTVQITSSGGGSGATFTVQTSGSSPNLVVTGITVTAGGSGYKGTVTASFIGGGGSGASAGTVTVATSSITGVTVATAGSGYTSAPSVTVAAPPSGVTAVVTANTVSAGLKIINGETYNSTYINGAGTVGEFAAKYPGAAGNSLLVSMADSATFAAWAYKAEFDSAPGTSTYASTVNNDATTANDELHIIVIDEDGIFTGTPGTILEKFAFASKASDARKSDGTNNYYKNVINSRSEYIWWMDHPTAVTGTTAWGSVAQGATFKALSVALTYALSGGTDDFNATDGELQTAYQLFDQSERYDISLVLAGKASTTVANYIIGSVCETRLDCVAFISPQDVSSGDPIIGSTSSEATKIVAYRNALPSSSYAVLDSGYKYQYDRYNDKYRWVPLNGDVAGLCARTDYTNDPWYSPGGLNRGQIKNVVRLAFNPNKTNRDTLYKSGVNPVVTFTGEGTVLFGDKTLLAKPSAFDRINVRRLFIVMEKAIATAAKFQLFEFNDGFTRAQFKNLVEPFLRDVQGRRGITDFVVKCDTSNNTGEVIDRNEFVADIFVKPNRSINFITLNFVAARSAINFSEIGA